MNSVENRWKLKNNTIKQVDDFSFMNWMNLQTLDMQYNQLSKPNAISKQAFKPLKRLKVLKFYFDQYDDLKLILVFLFGKK